MNIHARGTEGKLVIPDVPDGASQKERAHAYLDAGFPVTPWRVGRDRKGKKTKKAARSGFSFNDPDIIDTHAQIDKWYNSWQVGFACSHSTGFIALDVDLPEPFEEWDIAGKLPETVTTATGREGGFHNYLDCRALRIKIPSEDWPRQGDIPGGTLKTAGFVAAPGSRHPYGRLYEVIGDKYEVARGSLALVRALAEYRRARSRSRRSTGSKEPVRLDELWETAVEAVDGAQHYAVVELLNALQEEASDDVITSFLFPRLLAALPVYDEADPWTAEGLAERMWPPDKRPVFVSAAEQRELDALKVMTPLLAYEADAEQFWKSRESLRHIRDFAKSRRAGPWAVFGECLAEAICHTPPSFQLPAIIGAKGSLNMLIAIVGKPGLGKGIAAQVAQDAFKWSSFTDIDEVTRMPIGSGEGLTKCFGFYGKDENGKMGLIRTNEAVIVTVAEVDTLGALNSRSGATITQELRKLYSGETLGHAYSDSAKRVIIAKHSYRAAVVAGMQPGRGNIIVGETEGGFAQRWLYLPARDPEMPAERPRKEPPARAWETPGLIGSLANSTGPYEMRVCDRARGDIDRAHVRTHHDDTDDEDTHALYTRLKVAAGLALLDGCDEVRESDWELAAFVMQVSTVTRNEVKQHLRKHEHDKTIAAGRAEGIKKDVATTTEQNRIRARIARNVLKHVPTDDYVGQNLIGKKMPRDREFLPDVLRYLVETGALDERTEVNRNGTLAPRYRRLSKPGTNKPGTLKGGT